ncbi:MAG: hypothetical protein CSB44_01965 [Gammaproteobacteria bacterium]|nr:MAG: hypothetical protein CSB44_01965 [Gammaproteobacteria bacterium]
MRTVAVMVVFIGAIGTSLADESELGNPKTIGHGDVYAPATYSRGTIAEAWGLTEEEYKRYERLMITDRHFTAQNVTPYEILGKHAETEEEAKHYAQMLIDRQLEEYIKTMEWIMTLRDTMPAREEMTTTILTNAPGVREALSDAGVDVNRYFERGAQSVLEDGESTAAEALPQTEPGTPRACLYIDHTNCDRSCNALWREARALQEKGSVSGIDVVFIGQGEEKPSRADVSGWAKAHDVTMAEVRNRAITLNHETPHYLELRKQREIPLLIDSNGEPIP